MMKIKSYTSSIEAIEGSDDLIMTIPTAIIKSEKWRAGDVLLMDVYMGGILITNKSRAEREKSKKKVAPRKRLIQP